MALFGSLPLLPPPSPQPPLLPEHLPFIQFNFHTSSCRCCPCQLSLCFCSGCLSFIGAIAFKVSIPSQTGFHKPGGAGPSFHLSWGKTPQIPTRTGLKHKVSREFVLVWIETTPFVVCVVSPPRQGGQRGMFPLWGFPEGSPGHEQLLLVSVPTSR